MAHMVGARPEYHDYLFDRLRCPATGRALEGGMNAGRFGREPYELYSSS
jgi:hypothetical protein